MPQGVQVPQVRGQRHGVVAALRRGVVRTRRRAGEAREAPEAAQDVEECVPRAAAGGSEAKIKAREEKLAQWDLENKAGRLSVKGTGRGGETVVSPLAGKDDKGAMREFYKTVRSKPKGKTRKGGDATHAEED